MHRPLDPHTGPTSRAPSTKSPPAFINLDDCKPILSTTTTNTSTNSSANGTTAFVFTSARSLRAIQDRVDYYQLSPSSVPSTPSTPATPSSLSEPGKQRAALSLSQLVKHSEGAVDARSLLGPQMRAAGFVNLPNTLGSHNDLNCPSTPSAPYTFSSVSSHVPPMPNSPPLFPPIIFLPPSAMTSASMWEYQNDMQWSLTSTHHIQGRHRSNQSSSSSGSAGSSEFTPGPKNGFSPASLSPLNRLQPGGSAALQASTSPSGSDSSGIFSSASSSTLLSDSSTSLSPVNEAEEVLARARSESSKGKAKAREEEPSEFPFPNTSDSPRSRGSRASSSTASPNTLYVAPPATLDVSARVAVSSQSSIAHPTRTARPPSPRRRRRSDEKGDKAEAKTEGKDKVKVKEKIPPSPVEPTPSFATATRPGYNWQYSLAELCVSSPFAWQTQSDMFAPPAPIARSPIRPSTGQSIVSSPAISRPPPPPVNPPHPSPKKARHRRHYTTADGHTAHSSPTNRVHRIVSAPIRMPGLASEHEHRQVKVHDQGQHERHAHEPEGTGLLSAAEIYDGEQRSGMGVLQYVQDTGDRVGTARGRGRDTRGKVLGASETVEERAAGVQASEGLTELALAQRSLEFARQVAADRERTHVLRQKPRVTHKLGRPHVPHDWPSESETTMVDQLAPSVKPAL